MRTQNCKNKETTKQVHGVEEVPGYLRSLKDTQIKGSEGGIKKEKPYIKPLPLHQLISHPFTFPMLPFEENDVTSPCRPSPIPLTPQTKLQI